jgi:hypothetical protein
MGFGIGFGFGFASRLGFSDSSCIRLKHLAAAPSTTELLLPKVAS